jgi:hypothetical protein
MGGTGKPFVEGQSGNAAGRPKGSRNRATLAIEALLDGEAEAITRKVIEMALDGDGPALRLCLDRLAPPRRDRHTPFALPPIKTAGDAVLASSALVAAVAEGELTPSEAAELGKLVETVIRSIELTDVQERLARLEGMGK